MQEQAKQKYSNTGRAVSTFILQCLLPRLEDWTTAVIVCTQNIVYQQSTIYQNLCCGTWLVEGWGKFFRHSSGNI